jgi:hypothetical protein
VFVPALFGYPGERANSHARRRLLTPSPLAYREVAN